MPLASWESSSETLAFLVYVRGPLLAPTILPACPSSVGHIAGILYRLVILQMYSLCLLRWFSGLSIWCGFFFFSNFWLCWVFAAHRLSLTAMSRSCSLVVVPGLLLLQSTGSRAWLTGLVAPRHVGSSQTRDGTCVPNIGRRLWTFVKAVSLPIVAISFVVKDKPVTGSDHTSTPLYCHPCLAQLCGANSIAVFKRWGSPLENPPKTQALIKWVAF